MPHLSPHLFSCHSKGTTDGTWWPEDCRTSGPAAVAGTGRQSWGTSLPTSVCVCACARVCVCACVRACVCVGVDRGGY